MQISDEMIRDAVEVFMAGVSPEPWDTESATALVRQVLEAALSAEEREIPYHCDVCTVPGHGDAPCSPLCDRSAPSVAVKEGQMINNMLLSQVLQNAFFAGRGTSGAVSREDMAAWQDYDPYHLESFKRIRSALSAQVQDVAGWHRLDDAFSNFINGYGDPYEPKEAHEAETAKNLKELYEAFTAYRAAAPAKQEGGHD